MTDWDDLRFFLAVARAGSITGASRSLRVNYSTVIRRLNGFEERIGVRLFERLQSGYELTVAGNEMLESAIRIENEFSSLNRKALGRDARLSGVIRLATTDVLGSQFMPIFQEFLDIHPGIKLEVLTTSNTVNLSKRDADIALRVTNEPPVHLVSKNVGSIGASLYASKAYLKRHPAIENLEEHTWIGWDESHGFGSTSNFMVDFIPKGANIACRVNSGTSLRDAISAGMGIGYLWCFAGDKEPDFRRVQTDAVFNLGLWLLIHKDLYSTMRFRVFMDFVESKMSKSDTLLCSPVLEPAI